MLQTIREKMSGWVLFLIVGILIVPFALLGVGDYFSTNIATYVAKVGDEEISPDQVRRAIDNQRRQYRATFGEEVDLSFLNTPDQKRRLLDQLVDQSLLYQDGQSAGLIVPPERIREETQSIQAFQVEGRFDPDLYARVLSANQLTPRGFQVEQVKDITTREISSALSGTVGVSDAEVNDYLRLRDQRRDFAFVSFSGADLSIDETVSDEQIAEYYQSHQDEFMRPEQMTVDYVEIRGEALAEASEPTDEDLQGMYEEQKSRFVQPARALTSHILVNLATGADADAERAALEKAQALRARIEAGEAFADVAREASEDPGSADQGGDLGWIDQGDFFDPAFAEALFQLESGQLSEPVRGSNGYHLILAREMESERGRSFDEVREELRTQWVDDHRYKLFNELAGQLLSAINKHPRSLEEAVKEVELVVQRSGPFSADQGSGLFADPRVREAAFENVVKERRAVSDPIQLADEHVVVVQPIEVIEPAARPQEEVLEQIRAQILAQRRTDAVQARVESLQQQIADGADLATLASELGKEVTTVAAVTRTAPEQDGRILAEAFKLAPPVAGAPAISVVELSEQERVLIRLDAVVAGDPSVVDDATRTQVRQQLAQHWSAGEAAGYLEFLRAQTEIEINEARLP